MILNEYIPTEGKVLLNIDTFNWARRMLARIPLNTIELSEGEAEYFCQKYREELAKQQEEQEDTEVEEVIEEPVEEKPILLKGAKGLRAAAEVEPADPVQILKNLLKEEMVFKGYNLNNLVEPIIHELK